jgi:transposase-like protein
LIPKHERRFTGFDDKIIALYARGLTMREVQGFLLESYGVEVSAEFISSVTDAVVRNKAIYLAWGCCPMAHGTSWACGSRAQKGPSSG